MNVRQVVFWLMVTCSLASVSSVVAQQQVQIKGPKNATEQYSGTTYGPITSSDTLWQIASRYRQNTSLSVYQVMQAIYELNPDAFEQNNLNLLKNDAILRLPSVRYVQRIDVAEAQARAEQDDASYSPARSDGQTPAVVTPRPVMVSKEDLTETKEVLEQKLNSLDAEQNRQFEVIRQQFAQSIASVQTLLDENQKLYDRLDGVNEDIDSLRVRVDDELQIQMDQMLALQNELLNMSREAEAQRQAEMQKSSFAWLSNPLTLIIGSAVLTLGFLTGLTLWLLGRRKAEPVTSEPVLQAAAAAPVMEQTTELDDLSDALSDELSGDLDEGTGDDDLFGEDDLLDDVLSEELQESLDEALDEELESFDDLGDEMLVPDEDLGDKDEFESGDAVLEQGALDNLFDDDEDLLAEIGDDVDGIDLSDTDDLDDALDVSDATGADDELDALLDEASDDVLDDAFAELDEPDLDEAASEQADTLDAVADELDAVTDDLDGVTDELDAVPDVLDEVTEPVVEEEQDKPEISIDELLEDTEPMAPESIEVEESESVSEEMLQQLDKEIAQQNQELDNITDELLNEIEQLEQMEDMLPPEEDVAESANEGLGTQHGIQALDELGEDDMSDDELGEQDALADELLAELEADAEDLPMDDATSGTEEQDALADELLAELESELPEESTEDAVSEEETDPQNDLADELLAELESELPEEATAEETAAEETGAETNTESALDTQNDLADELLAELESEQSPGETAEEVSEADTFDTQNDLADELLAELEGELPEEEVTAEIDEDVGESDLSDEQDDLAEELLAELEGNVEEQLDADFDTQEEEVSEQQTEVTETLPEPSSEEDSDQAVSADQEGAAEEALDIDGDVDDKQAANETESAEADTQSDAEDDVSDELLAEVEDLEVDGAEADEATAEEIEDVVEDDEMPSAEAPTDALDDEDFPETPADAELPVDGQVEAEVDLASVENDMPDIEGSEADQEATAQTDVDLDGLDDDEFDDILSEEDIAVDSVEEESAQTPEDVAPDILSDSEAPESSEAQADTLIDDLEDIPSFTEADAAEEAGEMAEPESVEESVDEPVDEFDEALKEFEQGAEENQDNSDLDASIPSLDDIEALTDNDNDSDGLEAVLDDLDDTIDQEKPTGETGGENAAISEELGDLPGLDDWLSDEEPSEVQEDDDVISDLENSSFDELLQSIDSDDAEQDNEALLDAPDIDLEALLTEPDEAQQAGELVAEESDPEDDFLDVDALLTESLDAESTPIAEQPLDLDVALQDYSGVSGDADVIDVDSDQGMGAKLDLARAYIEMDDHSAARGLLQEVVAEGDAEQQEEARAILDKLPKA